MNIDRLVDWLGAAAGLGTASFGLVEALKGTPVGLLGVGMIQKRLGGDLVTALGRVYGGDVETMIRDTFRRGAPALADFLKNGLRMALTSESAETLARVVQQQPAELRVAVARLQESVEQPSLPVEPDAASVLRDRAVLGRFELAIDARVDAAVSAAQEAFSSYMRMLAMAIAIVAGTGVAILGGTNPWWEGLLLGVLATPLAPIAKDVMAVLDAARTALNRRGSA
jgi:hypothetical protein